MQFFTIEEFNQKYNITMPQIDSWKIEAASEMIYSQVGIKYRNSNWDSESVPTPIKNASMEQLRFMYEYDIPLIDYKGRVKAGDMQNELNSDYSTLALRILANAGYLYRGQSLNQNRVINLTWSS